MTVAPTDWRAGMKITAGRLAARHYQEGTVLVTWTSSTAGQWVQANVTFPEPFATVPIVQVTPQANAPSVGGTTTVMSQATGVSTTGFSVRALRSTAFTDQPFGWYASV